MWKVWGDPITTADMSGNLVYQKLKPNDDIFCLAVRIWVIVYNNPTYTSLSLKLYSEDTATTAPGNLILSSDNVQLKADVCTLANGVKEIWFHFNSPNGIALNTATNYYFVLNAVGYTGDASSHLAWMKAWPDPVYTTNLSTTVESLAVAPKTIYIIGSRL